MMEPTAVLGLIIGGMWIGGGAVAIYFYYDSLNFKKYDDRQD